MNVTAPVAALRPRARARSGELRFRRVVAWLLLYLRLQGALGLIWDLQWHFSIGRDSFLSPPHLAMYSATALGGLLALATVLVETVLYRRGAGVHDGNSVRVFGIFHAQLGVVLTGFGCFALLLSAALDNYWHTLYGLDATIWAPFHIMGLTGVATGMLGGVYQWAALRAETRPAELEEGAADSQASLGVEAWALLFGLMLLLGHLMTIAVPALRTFPTTDLGPLRIATYPILMALFVPGVLVVATAVVPRPGVASMVVLLLVVRDLAFQFVLPGMIRAGAAAEGLGFRTAVEPSFSIWPLALDISVLLAAVTLDFLLQRAQIPSRLGRPRPLVVGLSLGAVIWLVGLTVAAERPAAILALPPVLLFAVLSSMLGEGLGKVLRWNTQ